MAYRIEDISKMAPWAQKQIMKKMNWTEKKPSYADAAIQKLQNQLGTEHIREIEAFMRKMGVSAQMSDGTTKNFSALLSELTEKVMRSEQDEKEAILKSLHIVGETNFRSESDPGAGKYRNRKTVYAGIKFDSRKELRRFIELSELERAGEISDLRLQQNFTLQEAYTKPDGERVRGIVYRADFTYKKRIKKQKPILSPAERVEIGEEEQGSGRGMTEGNSERSGLCDDETLLYIVEDVKSKATKTRVYELKKKLMREKFGIEIQEV